MRAFLTGVSLFAVCAVAINAQDLQTRNLVLRGSSVVTINPPAAGGPYTFTLPSSSTTGTLLLNPSPGLGSTNAVLYGVNAAQNTNGTAANFLFNVSYDGVGTGATAGAVILSNAAGAPATSTGLTVSATGGTANYALIVPASGGNVGIGNSAPSALLSVGSSSQLTVDASGNVTTSGTATTGQHTITGGADLRINRTDNTVYNALKTDAAQVGNITYTLPATNGTTGQVLSIKSSPVPTATAATLEWVTPSGGGGGSVTTVNATFTSIGVTGACTDVTGLNFSANANTVYAITIVLDLTKGGGSNPDASVCFTLPANSFWSYSTSNNTNGTGAGAVAIGSVGGGGLTATITGTLVTGSTSGTFQTRLNRTAGGGSLDCAATSNLKYK